MGVCPCFGGGRSTPTPPASVQSDDENFDYVPASSNVPSGPPRKSYVPSAFQDKAEPCPPAAVISSVGHEDDYDFDAPFVLQSGLEFDFAAGPEGMGPEPWATPAPAPPPAVAPSKVPAVVPKLDMANMKGRTSEKVLPSELAQNAPEVGPGTPQPKERLVTAASLRSQQRELESPGGFVQGQAPAYDIEDEFDTLRYAHSVSYMAGL